jgi:hypothetical protein
LRRALRENKSLRAYAMVISGGTLALFTSPNSGVLERQQSIKFILRSQRIFEITLIADGRQQFDLSPQPLPVADRLSVDDLTR